MPEKKKLCSLLVDFVVYTVGSMLYALAFQWFYRPNNISMGGFTGISQILNHLIPVLPIGITTLLLNIPLFAIYAKKQGIRLLFSSLYCMATGALFLDIVDRIHTFEPMADPFLASVFGGLLLGVSCGIQLRLGATNGGTEMAARLLKYKFHHISVGKLCLAVDLCVIFLYALTFKNINNALYGIVSMYVFSLSADFVVYGGTHAKMAYIISDKSDEIKDTLLKLNFGVTTINGRGGWDGNEKQMVLCAFKRTQIAALKGAVTQIDPKAFIIVCEAHEVLGEGFGTYSPDEL